MRLPSGERASKTVGSGLTCGWGGVGWDGGAPRRSAHLLEVCYGLGVEDEDVRVDAESAQALLGLSDEDADAVGLFVEDGEL